MTQSIQYQPTLVDFYDEHILCIQDENNNVFVAVLGLCNNIGIDFSTQRKKIKDDPRFTYGVIPMRDARGRKQKLFCIKLEDVPGWLFSISPNKIRNKTPEEIERIQNTLIRYQRECMQVLHDYWSKGKAINPRGENNLAKGMPEILSKISDLETKLDEHIYRSDLKLRALASDLQTKHAKRIVQVFDTWMKKTTPGIYQRWAMDYLKGCVDESLSDYAHFELHTLFQEIYPHLGDKEAKELAKVFQTFPRVEELQKIVIVDGSRKGTKYMVKRYETQDKDELRELAIEWLSNLQPLKTNTA